MEDPRDRGMADVEREIEEKGADIKIDRMFIQTPTMAKYYQKYHDVVFMDATYNTNK